jgi:hypothetical protein
LSGLFLANTVVNPAESFAYQVGEILCFIAAPVLLTSGIAVYIMVPHERKKKRAITRVAAAPSRPTAAYSATKLLARRIVGVAFILVLFLVPGMSVLMVFFLPFILLSTPFGVIALLFLTAISILVAVVRSRQKKTAS